MEKMKNLKFPTKKGQRGNRSIQGGAIEVSELRLMFLSDLGEDGGLDPKSSIRIKGEGGLKFDQKENSLRSQSCALTCEEKRKKDNGIQSRALSLPPKDSSNFQTREPLFQMGIVGARSSRIASNRNPNHGHQVRGVGYQVHALATHGPPKPYHGF